MTLCTGIQKILSSTPLALKKKKKTHHNPHQSITAIA